MELQEVKSALDEAGRLYKGQFEHINGKIAALEAKGAAVDPLLLETREKLNKAIDEAAQKNETFIALQASVNKLEKLGVHVGDGKSRDFDGEAKSFSIERNSIAQAKGIPSPAASVSVDEYRAYTKAFDRYLRVGEKGLSTDEQKALSVGTDYAGGYLVSPDKSGQMVLGKSRVITGASKSEHSHLDG